MLGIIRTTSSNRIMPIYGIIRQFATNRDIVSPTKENNVYCNINMYEVRNTITAALEQHAKQNEKTSFAERFFVLLGAMHVIGFIAGLFVKEPYSDNDGGKIPRPLLPM